MSNPSSDGAFLLHALHNSTDSQLVNRSKRTGRDLHGNPFVLFRDEEFLRDQIWVELTLRPPFGVRYVITYH